MNACAKFVVQLLFAAFVATSVRAEPIMTVFAAASLNEALQSALADYPRETRLSVGGSGAIARQVVQGAPADVVILANPAWMDWLETHNVIQPGTRTIPIANRLVLVGPFGALPLADLNLETIQHRLGDSSRIAIGEHRSVPAGQYAKEWLETQNLWADLVPRLAEVDNVRAALALVSRGEVPLAIVYASDLVASADRVVPVWNIPNDKQPDIRYSIAAITQEGAALAQYLSGPVARQHFLKFGFIEAPK